MEKWNYLKLLKLSTIMKSTPLYLFIDFYYFKFNWHSIHLYCTWIISTFLPIPVLSSSPNPVWNSWTLSYNVFLWCRQPTKFSWCYLYLHKFRDDHLQLGSKYWLRSHWLPVAFHVGVEGVLQVFSIHVGLQVAVVSRSLIRKYYEFTAERTQSYLHSRHPCLLAKSLPLFLRHSEINIYQKVLSEIYCIHCRVVKLTALRKTSVNY